MLKGITESISSIQLRSAASQVITLGTIVSTALIIWRLLVLLSGSESPVVVVLSESMEPGFRRGDILFLNMNESPIQSGEIVVFKIEGKEIPIVHRVIKVHRRHNNANEINLLTKANTLGGGGFDCAKDRHIVELDTGDNNDFDDYNGGGIYADGQEWLEQHHVMGRVIGYLPYVGWTTIIMTEKPLIKYVLIGGLCLLAMVSN